MIAIEELAALVDLDGILCEAGGNAEPGRSYGRTGSETARGLRSPARDLGRQACHQHGIPERPA